MKTFFSILLGAAAAMTLASQASAMEMRCELGQKLAIAGNQALDKAIDLAWHGRQYRMNRVATSTGANRFENPESGLVWIEIPAKGMLLDAKRGMPLANECKAEGD